MGPRAVSSLDLVPCPASTATKRAFPLPRLPRTSLSRAAAAFFAGVDDGRLRPRRGSDAGQPGLSPQGPGAAPQRPAAQARKSPIPSSRPALNPNPSCLIRALDLLRSQMGQIHPTGLTPNLLKLFEPRPPLEYKPPLEKRKLPAYTGESVESGDYLLSLFSLLHYIHVLKGLS